MNFLLRVLTVMCLCLALTGPAAAQGAEVAFAGLKHDPSLPVEVTADQLSVSQSDGTAVFSGNVVVGQGGLRLTAGRLQVKYATGNSSRIEQMVASGGVIFVNGAEAAEARDAVYTLASGNLVLSGAVILTQGQSALSGERLEIDLNTGTGTMQGRVKTIFQPGSN